MTDENEIEVKDFVALEEAIKAAAGERRVYVEVLGPGDDIDWVAVEYGEDRLAVMFDGFIDVTDKNGNTAPIRPEMYPVVTAAIAEIERQNA